MEKQIAFVVYDGLTPLDLVGPLQVMSALERFAPEWKVEVVGETLDTVGTDTPLRVAPSATFADVPSPHAIIVPGGEEPTLRAMYDDAIQGYIRKAAETAEVVGSVCTGALILAAGGPPRRPRRDDPLGVFGSAGEVRSPVRGSPLGRGRQGHHRRGRVRRDRSGAPSRREARRRELRQVHPARHRVRPATAVRTDGPLARDRGPQGGRAQGRASRRRSPTGPRSSRG